MLLLALLIGIVAGLRAMTAPAAVAWAAHLGWISLDGIWLAFLGYRFTPWIFSLFALVELITDQLPSTPSRRVPPQFAARVIRPVPQKVAETAAADGARRQDEIGEQRPRLPGRRQRQLHIAARDRQPS